MRALGQVRILSGLTTKTQIRILVPMNRNPHVASPCSWGQLLKLRDVGPVLRQLAVGNKCEMAAIAATVWHLILRLPDGSLFVPPKVRWCLLIKAVIERFCPRFMPGTVVLYAGGGKTEFLQPGSADLSQPVGRAVCAAPPPRR